MSSDPPFDLQTIEIADVVSLIVVWPLGQGFDGGEVRVADEVADYLLTACFTTVERMKQRDPREYYPDMQLEEEELLIVKDEDLVADSAIAELVLPTSPLPLINARSLPRRRLILYAATIPADQGPLAFVRKANPRTGTKAGSLLAALGNSLRRIQKPVFALDDHFDLIVSEQGVISLHQHRFEQLFKETPALQARIPEWIAEIGGLDHPFAGDGADRLARKCQTDGRLRRRVRSIAERGHLATVTAQQIRAHIREAGLRESDFLDQDDRLIVDDEDPFRLVYLLNEDFFTGGLTAEAFRSDRKSPR